MTVFSPEKAVFVAVNSAFPRLTRGRSGRLGDAVMVLVVIVRRFVGGDVQEEAGVMRM